jgi:hypothetical protein
VGTVQALRAPARRPLTRLVAEQIDVRGAPGDPVIQPQIFGGSSSPASPLDRAVGIYLSEPHPVFRSAAADSPAWTRAGPDGRVFLVRLRLSEFFHGSDPYAGPDRRFRLVESREWDALHPIELHTYRRIPSTEFTDARLGHERGRLVLRSFLGRDFDVVPGEAAGAVDVLEPSDGRLTISGWAGDPKRHLEADWVVAMRRRRFLAADVPTTIRPDILKVDPKLVITGYTISARTRAAKSLAEGRALRVFTVVGGRAFELPRSHTTTP